MERIGGGEREEGLGSVLAQVLRVAGEELLRGAVLDQVGAEIAAGGKLERDSRPGVLVAGEDDLPALEGGRRVAPIARSELADPPARIIDQEQAEFVVKGGVACLESEGHGGHRPWLAGNEMGGIGRQGRRAGHAPVNVVGLIGSLNVTSTWSKVALITSVGVMP